MLGVWARRHTAATRGEAVPVLVPAERTIAPGPVFPARLGELLRRGCPQELVVDLGGLAFIDANGLRALTELRSRVEQQQAVLVLTGVPPQMRRVIHLIGPARAFRIRS